MGAKKFFKSAGRSIKKFGRTKEGKAIGRVLRSFGKKQGNRVDQMIKKKLKDKPQLKALYKAIKAPAVHYVGRRTGLGPKK